MTKLVDLSGGIYGRLTVISRDGNMYGKVAWLCECSCGVRLRVSGADLKSGNKSSCGCLKIDLARNKKIMVVEVSGFVLNGRTPLSRSMRTWVLDQEQSSALNG